MAALTADFARTARSPGKRRSVPVNALSVIYKGAIVIIDTDGYARPLVDTAGFRTAGIAYRAVTGGAADGDKWVEVEYDTDFPIAATSITQAMLNTSPAMYGVNDNEVDDAAGTTNDVYVGNLVEFTSTTLGWVHVPGLVAFPVSGVTATPTELNLLAGLTGALVSSKEATFTETTGAGVYTGALTIPAGATIVDVYVHGVAVWDATTSALMDVGDVADPNGIFAGVDLKATDLLAGEALSIGLAGGKGGADITATHFNRRYLAAARTISGIVTTVGAAGTLGRTRLVVIYTVPATAAATKV